MKLKQGLVTIELTIVDSSLVVKVIAKGETLCKRTYTPSMLLSRFFSASFMKDISYLLWPSLHVKPVAVICDHCGAEFYVKKSGYYCPVCEIEVLFDGDVTRQLEEQKK